MLNACQLLVCMHVCVHAQRERDRPGMREREREKESLNKSQKSSFEIWSPKPSHIVSGPISSNHKQSHLVQASEPLCVFASHP